MKRILMILFFKLCKVHSQKKKKKPLDFPFPLGQYFAEAIDQI
jgi:hypothetical protein